MTSVFICCTKTERVIAWHGRSLICSDRWRRQLRERNQIDLFRNFTIHVAINIQHIEPPACCLKVTTGQTVKRAFPQQLKGKPVSLPNPDPFPTILVPTTQRPSSCIFHACALTCWHKRWPSFGVNRSIAPQNGSKFHTASRSQLLILFSVLFPFQIIYNIHDLA